LEGVHSQPGQQDRKKDGKDQQGSRQLGGPSIPHKNCSYKRQHKVWKPKQRHPRLTLGMDVELSEACNLALCALVGRLAYKEKCKQNFADWISTHWKPVLGYLPKIHSLQQGWYGFIFKKPEDSVHILEKF
jgi:hypothetical protein